MKLGSVTVTVDVEDKSLHEYDVKLEGNKEASCFVASEAGTFFSFNFTNESEYGCSFQYLIDGRSTGRFFVRAHRNARLAGAHIEPSRLRPFLFQPLSLTDDDNVARPSQVMLEKLGTIQVNVFRGKQREQEGPLLSAHLEDLSAIHEKSKKAGSHCVKFGNIEPSTHVGVSVDYIDPPSGAPYHQYMFKYRPKAILQAQGIMPLEPRVVRDRSAERPGPEEAGPSNAGHKRSHDEEAGGRNVRTKLEDLEELDNLLAEQAALEARIHEARARNIKREPSPIVLGSTKGEVIDLTLD